MVSWPALQNAARKGLKEFKLSIIFPQVDAKSFTHATLVKITPMNPKYKKELVPLLQSGHEIAFFYQKCKYIYNESTQTFEKPEYPTHGTFEFYKKATGYQTTEEFDKAEAKYGLNK